VIKLIRRFETPQQVHQSIVQEFTIDRVFPVPKCVKEEMPHAAFYKDTMGATLRYPRTDVKETQKEMIAALDVIRNTMPRYYGEPSGKSLEIYHGVAGLIIHKYHRLRAEHVDGRHGQKERRDQGLCWRWGVEPAFVLEEQRSKSPNDRRDHYQTADQAGRAFDPVWGSTINDTPQGRSVWLCERAYIASSRCFDVVFIVPRYGR